MADFSDGDGRCDPTSPEHVFMNKQVVDDNNSVLEAKTDLLTCMPSLACSLLPLLSFRLQLKGELDTLEGPSSLDNILTSRTSHQIQ